MKRDRETVKTQGSLQREPENLCYVTRLCKGFKRVNIAAGATENVTISLAPEAFAYYSAAIDELAPMAGRYQILYGSSSRDEDLKAIDFQVL